MIIENLNSKLRENESQRKEYRNQAKALCTILPNYPNSKDLMEIANELAERARSLAIIEAEDKLIIETLWELEKQHKSENL